MKKIDELKQEFEQLKDNAQNFLNQNKTDEAKAKLDEARALKTKIEVQNELDKEENEKVQTELKNKQNENKNVNSKNAANSVRAIIKKIAGKKLTEAENALLLPTPEQTEGINGESYILPQDIQTIIHKKIREYKSLRDVLGYMPTSALTGSFPIENFETVSELIDFTDGEDGEEINDIKFSNISYSLKEKAAFIKLSNTLLSLTDNALIQYVSEVFAKKAVITENRMGIEKLKLNKTVKKITDWKKLKSSINKDIDPAMLYGTVIVTNQDGFDYLDSALDTNGRPILQSDPTNPTKKTFCGYPIIAYSNSMIKTTGNKVPVFYGNLKEAVKYVDLNGRINFSTSSEAGFMSNTTVARLIEFIDVVQCDNSDKCYICGEIDISEPVTA